MNFQGGVATATYIHWFFDILWVFGLVLLLAWTIKHLSKKNVLTVAVATLILGVLGSLLTAQMAFKGWRAIGHDIGLPNMMGDQMTEIMIEHMEEEHDGEDFDDTNSVIEHMTDQD